jgi:hypothetical protein
MVAGVNHGVLLTEEPADVLAYLNRLGRRELVESLLDIGSQDRLVLGQGCADLADRDEARVLSRESFDLPEGVVSGVYADDQRVADQVERLAASVGARAECSQPSTNSSWTSLTTARAAASVRRRAFGLDRLAQHTDAGEPFWIYSAPRCIVDAMRLPHFVGRDVALAALSLYMRQAGADPLRVTALSRQLGGERRIREALEVQAEAPCDSAPSSPTWHLQAHSARRMGWVVLGINHRLAAKVAGTGRQPSLVPTSGTVATLSTADTGWRSGEHETTEPRGARQAPDRRMGWFCAAVALAPPARRSHCRGALARQGGGVGCLLRSRGLG